MTEKVKTGIYFLSPDFKSRGQPKYGGEITVLSVFAWLSWGQNQKGRIKSDSDPMYQLPHDKSVTLPYSNISTNDPYKF